MNYELLSEQAREIINAEPWYVVSAGEYSTESAANSFLARVKQYCPDAYVKWTGSFIG